MDWANQLQILGEVALAMVLGAFIGTEREIAEKPAGLRAQMLVAGAAALLVGLGDAMLARFAQNAASGVLRSDPIRIIEAIVTAVGFLGAGTIIRRSDTDHVEGLTTAASILFAAAVGICVSLRQFVLAFGVTALALLTLRAVKRLEVRLLRPRKKPAVPGS